MTRAAVTREAVAALGKIELARKLVARLVAAKSDHAWTNEECTALADLCRVLGVDIP